MIDSVIIASISRGTPGKATTVAPFQDRLNPGADPSVTANWSPVPALVGDGADSRLAGGPSGVANIPRASLPGWEPGLRGATVLLYYVSLALAALAALDERYFRSTITAILANVQIATQQAGEFAQALARISVEQANLQYENAEAERKRKEFLTGGSAPPWYGPA